MNGDFASLGFGEHECLYLTDVYETVDKLDLWEELKTYSPEEGKGFMFSQAQIISKISSNIKLLDEHTGASYAWTLRQIEYIAKNGWEQYKLQRKPL